MNTLTCAELASYPGGTLTERLRAHHAETIAPVAPSPAPAAGVPSRRGVGGHAASLPRRIDVRRFPGKSRVERVGNYLRAHLPRCESWGQDAILEYASRLLTTAEVVE